MTINNKPCPYPDDCPLNRKWVDRPNSEGWWWFYDSGRIYPAFVMGAFAQFWRDDKPIELVRDFNGKWQKAIMPEEIK